MGSIRKQKNLEAVERLKPNVISDQGNSMQHASSTSLIENSVESIKGYDINKKMWIDSKENLNKRRASEKGSGIS